MKVGEKVMEVEEHANQIDSELIIVSSDQPFQTSPFQHTAHR